MENKEDKDIELWRMRNLITKLSKLQGTGTSVITLLLPPTEQISNVNNHLTKEYGTATNVKNRVNKLSILSAVTSAQQRLKLYRSIPTNGLVILCGTVQMEKEKKLSISFEPPKPLHTYLYMCDNKFHLDPLIESLGSNTKTIGFIIIDGNGLTVATLCDNVKKILHKFTVDLPKKHGRGGQSKLRFERLAEEARHNFRTKSREIIERFFFDGCRPVVDGIILAGSGSMKNKLKPTLRIEIQNLIRATTDVSANFDQGLNEAINLNTEILSDMKYMEEQKLLGEFFDYISKGLNKICYGQKDTLYALEEGLLERMILSENCNLRIKEEDINNEGILSSLKETSIDSTDSFNILDFSILTCRSKSTKLCLVSDCSTSGNQFLKSFGGIGGILRYETILKTDIDNIDIDNSDDDDMYF